MRPHDPQEAKRLVAEGYDRVAEAYARWILTARAAERRRYTDMLLRRLPARARILDLGCGSGVPTTRDLAEHHAVTGVDISAEQIRLARAQVPGAEFLVSDMAALALPAGSFDAVAAFYSLIHLPRAEQVRMLHGIHRWLRPEGLFLGTFGTVASAGDIEPDWLGAPMYWSSYDAPTYRGLIAGAGFTLVHTALETVAEHGEPVTFLWVLASRNAPRSQRRRRGLPPARA